MTGKQQEKLGEAALASMIGMFEELALKAGAAIMPFYEDGCETQIKQDNSPVTAADHAAEEIILAGLRAAYPDIPVVAEEEVCAGHMTATVGQRFFLVDPLDGTREFINQRSDFTVNIALIEDGQPVAGTVYAPVRGAMYSGFGTTATETEVVQGRIGRKVAVKVSGKARPEIAVASRSHRTEETDAFLKSCHITDCVSVGSSLKFCLLAKGDADIYPRFGRTMEWDTAAGDAVLRAAGGSTTCADGSAFAYGKQQQSHDEPFANPFFISMGHRQS
uniref:3'(2'),5'-bisphosphate nucleotidase CysQ n=1 Tax=Pararhizobium sp. IMCC3301 TaxID=3067904 RepID=UPI00274129D7|nr:3'(2'),5'-bisphosphate nucleotidase CysQ [Pararhizobium sp. IMCC3301]